MLSLVEVGMVDETSTAEEIRTWVAANNTVWFQRQLDAGTDELRYKVLAALLANELGDFKPKPLA
jgi:hypothetical protein